MYMLVRPIWSSSVLLILIYAFYLFKVNLILSSIIVVLSSYFISSILVSKRKYQIANRENVKQLAELDKKVKQGIYMLALFETLAISVLINIHFFTSKSFISNILFFLGAVMLIFSHFVKNREEYKFYDI
ncbi:hypothetical protein [Metabacillus fastidiosus]|uniref:hypothetical protein n=1 Tax=Metabacillus fastidiosus TaxID=1458 RepID=UPI000825BC9D|nr:hypothetical protein [Metabacillus fastidiosus]